MPKGRAPNGAVPHDADGIVEGGCARAVVRDVVEGDRLAQRVGGAAILLMPQSIREHRHPRRLGAIILGGEDAADLCLHAE